MKSRGGKSQRREEKRREEKRREEKRRGKKIKKRKSQKKEDPGARKSRKVAKYCKVGLLKRRVQSQLAR